MIVHEEHHDVSGRAPDMIAHTSAINSHKHGSAPAMLGATGCYSPAVATTEYEGKFFVPWNDGDTLRRFQKIRRNALIRSIHDLLEDLGSFLGAVHIIFSVRGD